MKKYQNTLTFADPACRQNLMAALQGLAEPVKNHGPSPEAEARRKAAEDARAKGNAEASRPARAHVSRASGERAAAAAVARP